MLWALVKRRYLIEHAELQENKKLKSVLPKTFARPELDKRRLGEVVTLFTNIKERLGAIGYEI